MISLSNEALVILRYIWCKVLPSTDETWLNTYPAKQGLEVGRLFQELEEARVIEVSAPTPQRRYVMLTETGAKFCRGCFGSVDHDTPERAS